MNWRLLLIATAIPLCLTGCGEMLREKASDLSEKADKIEALHIELGELRGRYDTLNAEIQNSSDLARMAAVSNELREVDKRLNEVVKESEKLIGPI